MNKKYLLIVLVLLIAGIAIGYYFYNQRQVNKESEIVTETESDLTALAKFKTEIALKEIDAKLQQQPSEQEEYDLLLDKAEALIELGRLEEADRPLKDAIELRPKTTRAYSQLYDLQLSMNRIDDAETTIKKIMELNPVGSYWRKYIDFLRSKRQISNEEANELFRKALTDTQNDIIVVTSYARFLEETGDMNRAKEYWMIAGQVNPKDKADYDAEIDRIDGKPAPSSQPVQ